MNIFKAKWFPWATVALAVVIALFVVFIASYNSGYANGKAAMKAKIDGKMVTYNGLLDKINSAKKTLINTKVKIGEKEGKLSHVSSELDTNKAKFDRLTKLADQKDQLTKKVNGLKSQVSTLNGKINDKQAELSKLKGGVQKAKGAPIELGAGRFVVGKDVPAGRYKVTPRGEGSNFITFDTSGSPDVNTILGAYGAPSYVFVVGDGYIIQSEAPVTLTPVK
ncbi:MAG TPA: hypothetical protein VFK33_10935 [Bacillales bacterium]|nr:hypothetical protein [Bacillales bacterium]